MADVVTFTKDDFAGQGTANTGSEVTATKGGVTFTYTKGYCADESLRCYAHGELSITATSTIQKINFTTTGGKTGGLDAEVTVGATSYVVADLASQARFTEIAVTLDEGGEVTPPTPTMNYYVTGSMTSWGPQAAYMLTPDNEGLYKGEFTFAANDEFKVTYSDGTTIEDTNWFPSGMDNNYKITEAGDYAITFNPAGGVEDWYYGYFNVAKKETPAGPTTCAEAAAAALSVSANNELYNDGAVYSITGFVTAIQTAYNSQFNNVSFWMADDAEGGKVIQAYRAACASAEDAPTVGDKVTVTGSLTKYNTTPEFAAGCTYVIVESAAPAVNLGEKTIAEFLALKNVKDTCILTGVVDSIKNTTYGNLYLSDETAQVYIYGVLTAAGESKKFADLDVTEGDTLTVKAIYGEFNNVPQVTNAIFVEVRKAEGGEESLSYDYEPTEVTTINLTATTIKVEDYTADYGVVYIELGDEDGNWVSLEFIASSYDGTLPAGTFEISASEAEGTFYASPGGDDEYDYGCYVGIMNGEYYNPYYLISGTVTIDAEGNITVAATSYNGSTINATYVAESQGIEETLAEGKAVKVIREGNVRIMKGDKTFSVMGQIVK